MDEANVLICGNLEEVYSLQGRVELCVLDTEEELAKKNAYFKNLKLYNSISQLPNSIKLAYIPKTSLIASDNSCLRQELLEAGISVFDECPRDLNQIKDCLKIANNKKIYYIPEIPGGEDDIFFKKCINIIYGEFNKGNIIHLNGIFSNVLVYYVFKILKEGLQTNHKINIVNEYNDSIITTIFGHILSIPFCVSIYKPNINDEYRFIEYSNELKLFTKNGSITIDLIHKKIQYNNKMFEKSIDYIDFSNKILRNKHTLNIRTVIDMNLNIDLINYRYQIQEVLNDFSFIQDINKALFYSKNISIGTHKVQTPLLTASGLKNSFNYDRDWDISNINEKKLNVEKKYSHISNEYLLKYKEKLEFYILGEIYNFFRKNGVFNEYDVKYSEDNILNKYFGGKNSKIVKRWLKKLVTHGFIECKNEGVYTIKNLKIDTNKLFFELRKLWDWKLGDPYSIDYIKQNIKYLKELFYGDLDCNTILFPEGDIKYATALYKDNIIYRFLNEIIGIQVAEYVNNYSRKNNNKIVILEIGAGIGATTDNIIEELKRYDLFENINYLYTDVSKFFLDIGKEKYGINSKINYLKFDIDNINELKKIEDVNIIVAAGVLNNSRHLENVLKELLNKIKPDGMMLITEPMDEPIEMLVSQVFMMEEPDDIRNVKNATFLELSEWIELINRCGNFELSIFPRENHSLNIFGQKLFVIRKKGR
ncbi:class I SAM-dependent methyltransferase [Streptococcus suis]|uniref:class I SAM-dependent methyltransferase n=1 Tax=Streptococcus suis TaxID=1307 RepID=UPI003757487B|nr:class I SAM-dependent methyltransferase [Streptococcus suis]